MNVATPTASVIYSTVIYSCDKITKELKTNTNLQEEIKILKEKICE